ncbi:carbohydrate porin [Sabulicella glaciei]|uniref:Carbohydrate porin n=1 Tax=Sabulicella glaciei TaxID=2984948 RepID=A0ABT3NZL2_9PROT|nr:carbohydrate porin [Roseococcus sp. MDT2-1-1]MCW8087591.1 carbohydrate porin [Roseococcus sp. MDT2-1-1]
MMLMRHTLLTSMGPGALGPEYAARPSRISLGRAWPCRCGLVLLAGLLGALGTPAEAKAQMGGSAQPGSRTAADYRPGTPPAPSRAPGVANVGPPEAALLPGAAALQDRLEDQGWMVRGQATFILQGHPAFRSPYRGPGSLSPAANARNTFSADLVLGRRLWQGAEFIVNASVTRGFGVSNSTGIAAFPNNEAFRLGTTEPYIYTPRILFRQTIGLSSDTVPNDDDPLRFSTPLPRERITITAGKMSVWDIFDDNRYAHDPRTQFLNWAHVGGAAFDYAADARGWTPGVAVEWENGSWGVRVGAFQVARRVNGLFMDPALTRAWQVLGQIDRFYQINGRPGALRLTYGASRARQSTWGEIFRNGFDAFEQNPAGYRLKNNLSLGWEQEVTDDLGVFARLSWNDGRTQNWMFTEMDRAVSGGASLRGLRWNRPEDTVGLAANVGWISDGRRQYLEQGGIGFITGDGRLNYRPEIVTEAYYDARVAPGVNIAANYQFVANPAYNADRGPVHLFALRLRVGF